MVRLSALVLASVILSASAFAQSGGGSGGGGGGSSGGGSSSGGSASGAASGNASTGSPSANASSTGANAISGTTNNSTLSNSLQVAPGTPNTQPNTYNALSQGSSANQMGAIGGSNSNGSGNPAPGSAVDSLTSTNTGVMAPSSGSSGQSGR